MFVPHFFESSEVWGAWWAWGACTLHKESRAVFKGVVTSGMGWDQGKPRIWTGRRQRSLSRNDAHEMGACHLFAQPANQTDKPTSP